MSLLAFGFVMADASSDSAGATASPFRHTSYLSVDWSSAPFPIGAPEHRPLEWEEFVKTLGEALVDPQTLQVTESMQPNYVRAGGGEKQWRWIQNHQDIAATEGEHDEPAAPSSRKCPKLERQPYSTQAEPAAPAVDRLAVDSFEKQVKSVVMFQDAEAEPDFETIMAELAFSDDAAMDGQERASINGEEAKQFLGNVFGSFPSKHHGR